MDKEIISFAKVITAIGFMCLCVGGILFLTTQLKIPFLGKLPGDIAIKRGNFSFYFPLASSLLISFVFSVIISFFSRR